MTSTDALIESDSGLAACKQWSWHDHTRPEIRFIDDQSGRLMGQPPRKEGKFACLAEASLFPIQVDKSNRRADAKTKFDSSTPPHATAV